MRQLCWAEGKDCPVGDACNLHQAAWEAQLAKTQGPYEDNVRRREKRGEVKVEGH